MRSGPSLMARHSMARTVRLGPRRRSAPAGRALTRSHGRVCCFSLAARGVRPARSSRAATRPRSLHAPLRLRPPHRARQLLPGPREAERLHARRLDPDLRGRPAAPARGRHRRRRDPRRRPPRRCTGSRATGRSSPASRSRTTRSGSTTTASTSTTTCATRRCRGPAASEQLKRALRAHHAAAPRPRAPALGDVDRRGPRGRPLRADLEGRTTA